MKHGFNTQPREGGCTSHYEDFCMLKRFNTQPREGGCLRSLVKNDINTVSTHSRAKAAALRAINLRLLDLRFQHTAARRRLRSIF